MRDDAEPAHDGEPTPREAPISVLLIEDDIDMRETLACMLERAGYRVTSYGQAREALADLDAGLRAELVLLDLMMPGMNGWQFRVEQRQRPHLHDIPVIAISADLSAPAAAVDADAFVQKPFEMERLLATMERVLLARERKRLTAKSVELERVRSLGMAVAGVMHEINNPLAYVAGHLELAARRLQKLVAAPAALPRTLLDELARDLRSAQEGTDQIAFIVKLLSTFSRPTGETAVPSDVVRALDAATRLAMHHVRDRAQLICRLEPVRPVLANEGQLAQVFVNLLVNAAQAIPTGSPGTHRIAVRMFEDGEDVVVEISDSGMGMAPEVAAHIFEPFYTTKAPGEGTGLGLSISHDIIRGFGGTITLKSELGRGTTFCVRLPSCASGSGGRKLESGTGDEDRGHEPVIDGDPATGRRALPA